MMWSGRRISNIDLPTAAKCITVDAKSCVLFSQVPVVQQSLAEIKLSRYDVEATSMGR
jgi:hypothetical protein